jgi:hypothetical protein
MSRSAESTPRGNCLAPAIASSARPAFKPRARPRPFAVPGLADTDAFVPFAVGIGVLTHPEGCGWGSATAASVSGGLRATMRELRRSRFFGDSEDPAREWVTLHCASLSRMPGRGEGAVVCSAHRPCLSAQSKKTLAMPQPKPAHPRAHATEPPSTIANAVVRSPRHPGFEDCTK